MNEPDPTAADDTTANATAIHSARPIRLSMIGLILGIAALALATLPALALNRPPGHPLAQEPKQPAPTDTNGGVTVKFKNFSFSMNGNKDDSAPQPQPELQPEPAMTPNPTQAFPIAAIVLALAGIVFSGIGQVREQHTSLTVIAMGCCVAAMTWQYFAAGIMIGAAVAILLMLIATLGLEVA